MTFISVAHTLKAAGSNPRRAALTDEQKAKMKDRAERFGMPFKG